MTDIDTNSIKINCPADRLSAADQEVVALRLTGEHRVFDMDWHARQRAHRIKYVVAGSESYWYVKGYRTIAVFINTGEWWIVVDDPMYDKLFKDMGPFDTAEAALHHLRINYARTICFTT